MGMKFYKIALFGIIIGICILAFFYLNWGNSLPLSKKSTVPSDSVSISTNKSIIFSSAIQRPVNASLSRAIDVVSTFSKNPNLIITNFQTIVERDGCNSTLDVYHITTSEGIYRVNSKNDQLISVIYNTSLAKPLAKPLTQHQAIKISQTFLQEKFSNYSSNLSIPDSDARELVDHYQLVFPETCPLVNLMIDKKTGQVTEYSNWVAPPRGCMCWGDGSCSTIQNTC
jgi:hypothetical protein